MLLPSRMGASLIPTAKRDVRERVVYGTTRSLWHQRRFSWRTGRAATGPGGTQAAAYQRLVYALLSFSGAARGDLGSRVACLCRSRLVLDAAAYPDLLLCHGCRADRAGRCPG